MKFSKCIKFILPTLALTPVVGLSALTSCSGANEDIGVPATKVTITNVTDQQEFDVQKTKKITLEAKVEPAEASQDVTYEILAQEGTGNIACSASGIIYSNSSTGTITIRAWSKGKKVCSDPIELVFWDSNNVKFLNYLKEETGEDEDYCYVACPENELSNISEIAIPTTNTIMVNGVERTIPVVGTGYGSFSAAQKLWYVHLPKNSQKFTYIGSYSFYQCNKLTSINVPDSVDTISAGSFEDCSTLETVNLGKNVQYIYNSAFKNCFTLVNMELPNSLLYIGPSALADCIQLKHIYIGPKLSVIGEAAFADCWNSAIVVDENNDYFSTTSDALYNKDHTRLLTCQYSSTTKDYQIEDSVEKIDSYAFVFCTNIETIKFSSNSKCKSIGQHCFTLCSGITNIELGCKQLTRLNEGIFSYCSGLKTIHIPENITEIDKDAFYGCDSLAGAYFSDTKHQWKVENNSFDKPFERENVVSFDDVEGPTINAFSLKNYGSYISEPGEEQYWTGGYCNCTWTKISL